MSEIERHQGANLDQQMMFARLVADGSILPDTYRRNPSNVLIAVGLGQSMGLSPAESLYRIAVIKGKPTAGAELIAANVRRAGHKLRVQTDDANVRVKATIIRADDPDFPHEVVRDMAWAQSMGLDKNDNYRKQPVTMLQWRAITAVARLACPEALYGVSYTPDEMFDMSGGQPPTVEHVAHQPSPAPDAASSSAVDDAAGATHPEPDVQPSAGESPYLDTSSPLAKAMFAAMGNEGIGKDIAHDFLTTVTGREITSSKQLTEDDARQVLDYLKASGADA